MTHNVSHTEWGAPEKTEVVKSKPKSAIKDSLIGKICVLRFLLYLGCLIMIDSSCV